MKIANQEPIVDKAASAGEAVAPKQKQAARPLPSGDRVSLSPRSREFAAARRALEAIPDVRADKVAELKARIEAGTYRIVGTAVADKMIRDAFPDD